MPGILKERLSAPNKNKEADNAERGLKKKLSGTVPEDDDLEEMAMMDPTEDGSDDETDSHMKIHGDDEPSLTEEDIRQLDEIDQMMSDENFVAETKRKKFLKRMSTAVLTIACCYLVVLIYGSFITEFQYDSDGKVAPVILSVSDISDRNEYSTIIGLYVQTRSLYETLLTLDYRMAAGEEDTMSIAPDYEQTLDTVSSLTTQIDAAVINSKYTQVKNMLLTWVQTHAAAYCQYMSQAVTQNDSDAAAEAIAARQVLSDNFSLITENIVTLGENIKGYDLTDIKDWSPDGYIAETIEGVDSDSSSENTTETTETLQTETSEEVSANGSTELETTAEGMDDGLQDVQSQILQDATEDVG